jgi:hypothetical protein
MHPCITSALCLLVLVPLSARAAPLEVESRLRLLEPVAVSEHHNPTHGRGFKLTFKPLRPDPALARFTLNDARAVVAALEEEFTAVKSRVGAPSLAGLPTGVLAASVGPVPTMTAYPSDLERWVREGYVALYGPSSTPVQSSLESARWFQALRLSPR